MEYTKRYVFKYYIKFYSGATFKYFKINKAKKEEKYIVAPFNEVESTAIEINNMDDVWMWTSERLKKLDLCQVLLVIKYK